MSNSWKLTREPPRANGFAGLVENPSGSQLVIGSFAEAPGFKVPFLLTTLVSFMPPRKKTRHSDRSA